MIPGRRAQQPTAVFLPGESHGQRSLAGYSPGGHKKPDTTEVTEHLDFPGGPGVSSVLLVPPLPGTLVPSLIQELRSHMLLAAWPEN